MKVVVAAMGTRGDVQPIVALARALRAAGHEPVVCGPENFQGWVESLELPFVPICEDTEQWLRAHVHDLGGNPLRLLRGFRDMVRSQAPHWFRGLMEASRGARVIVAAAVFAAASVAEARGVPYMNVFYTPTAVPSSVHTPLMVPWQRLPVWLNRLLWWFQIKGADLLFRGPINTGRAGLGLTPQPNPVRDFFDRYPTLLAVDPEISPPPADWPATVHPTGYWFHEDPTPLPADLEAFLSAGPPPVFVGFGSMMTRDATPQTRAVMEGVSATGRRLLLAPGWAGLGGGAMDRGFRLTGPVSHAQLFPRMAAVVHHGGAGTTATALRMGVPQVIVPHALDQFYWGERMRALELAPAPIPVTRLNASILASRIEQAIGQGAQARLEVAGRLRQSRGLTCAVRAIEAHVDHS